MEYQKIFKRYESKYLLDEAKYKRVMEALRGKLSLDRYGRVGVRSLYLDTDDYLLIRRSIEKPTYKEKLRLRSYKCCFGDDNVFLEIKKKYKGIVYKRRMTLPLCAACDWIARGEFSGTPCQISAEIDYMLSYYKTLTPRMLISYEREAYSSCEYRGLRVTFDDNILARSHNLSLSEDIYGEELLPRGVVLMEIKSEGGLPLWLTELLAREKIFKSSFSKYGEAYKRICLDVSKSSCN